MHDNEIIKALKEEIHLVEYVDGFSADNVSLELLKNVLDLINRQKAEIERSKAADVEPVRHGRWIKTANTWTHDYNEKSKPIYYCSLCGRYEKLKEPYCNCGAKMDGE